MLDGIPVRVDCSIGIACYPEHASEGNDLLRHADTAMYEAKRRGGGYRFYDATRDSQSPRRLMIAAALPDAVENGEITLHYQPKINLSDGRVTSVEALARWEHPHLGTVRPDEFIVLAEELGLLGNLTTLIMEMAMTQCRRWHDLGHRLCVAVNFSASSLADPDLSTRILHLLERHRLPPAALELEITESSLMHDPVGVIEVLRQLNTLGITLSIDDFGTGYSSLSYLKELPVHELKIDRSFVTGMNRDSADEFIVNATIDLGHRLGLRIVAEGVEDAAVLETLRVLGCDQAQGYHIARPAPAEMVTAWLDQHVADVPESTPGQGLSEIQHGQNLSGL